MSVDLEYVSAHFNPDDPRLIGEGPLLGDGLWNAIDLMLAHCPVVRSDGQWVGIPRGGWVVNRYADVMTVLQDPGLFSNLSPKGLDDEPSMPPLEADPPLHTEYRRLLQPYLSLRSVARFEPTAREIVTRLIDSFIETGRCDDFVSQVGRPFAADVQWRWLVGVEAFDLAQVQEWIEIWVFRHFEPEFEAANRAWQDWMLETIAKRRLEPRRDDVIDGLLHGTIEGRLLTDDEVRGVLMIMILGGFSSTGDALSNMLLRLAVYPELQEQLHAEPEIVPQAIEELLRIEPPITGLTRRCTRDTVLGGKEIKEGEQLFYMMASANRDPAEFENPLEVDFHRGRSRHLSFGAGHHRCLGSNFARQNLRIVLEEILRRMKDIRVPEGEIPRRTPNVAWGLEYLPLTFKPGPRIAT